MDLKGKSLLILAIFILFISSISAEELNDTIAIETMDLSASDTLETISVNEDVESNTSAENNSEVVETNIVENKSNEVNSVATPTAQTFAAINSVIKSASAGDTIQLSGTYTGSGTQITVNKNLNFVGVKSATLDAQTLNRIIYINGAYTVTFTNITFKNGKPTATSGPTSYGGAVYIWGDSMVNFINCNFTDNNATSLAGAVYIRGFANFTNCNFTSNTATGDSGGAVYIGSSGLSSGSGNFTNCNFRGNTATTYYGGAVFIGSSSLGRIVSGNFVNCHFTDNNANSYGGTVYILGFGNFTNCHFTDNVTDKNKELIYMTGTSAMLFLNGNSIITNSTPIYTNQGVIISSTVLVALNNQTIESPLNTEVDLSAVLYDDNGNIIGSSTGITLNVAESSLTASFNRDNLNYSVSYTPTVGGVFPVTGTVPTSVANNVTEYKNGTLIIGITTLSVDLTVNNTNPVVDELVQYTITIKNNGSYKAGTVAVEDILDNSKLEYVNCSPEDAYNPDTGIWLVENLDINQESSLNITVRVKSTGEINNTVTAKSKEIKENITKNVTIIASKKTTNINGSADDVVYGDNVTIAVNVTSGATGNVTVKINNKTYDVVDLTDSKGLLSIPGLAAGNYTAELIYNGDENYNPTNTTITFKVNKGNVTTLEVEILNNTYGNVTVKITVPNDATGNITIFVNDKNYTGNISNGSVIIKLPDVPVGNYTMNVTYPGDDKYNPTTGNELLEVIKANTNLEVEILNNTEGNVIIKITVPDGVTGNITLVIDDKEYMVELINGTAKFIITDIPAGSYNIQAIYSGDNNFNGFIKNLTLEIIAKSTNSTTTNSTINNSKNTNDSYITKEISNLDSLENIKTANPIAILLLILLAIPLRRKKDD